MLGIVSKRICLGKPSGKGGSQCWNKVLPNVKESETGRAEQVFEGSGNIKIQVHCFHVNRAGSAILVIIEHYQSPGVMSDLRDRLHIGTKSVLKADVCEPHDASVAVDHPFIICG